MNKKNYIICALIVAAIGLCVGVLPDICSPKPLPEPLVVDDAPVVELTKEISDVAVSEDASVAEAVNEDTLVEEDSGDDATATSPESP
jgi:hypothetical protein